MHILREYSTFEVCQAPIINGAARMLIGQIVCCNQRKLAGSVQASIHERFYQIRPIAGVDVETLPTAWLYRMTPVITTPPRAQFFQITDEMHISIDGWRYVARLSNNVDIALHAELRLLRSRQQTVNP